MLVKSRSKACGVCQKRKVKCDKVRPRCLSCIKDGWECPGYETVWKEKIQSQSGGRYFQYESQWLLGIEEQDVSKLPDNHQDTKCLKVLKKAGDQQHVIQPPRCSLSSSSISLAQKLVGLLEEDMDFGVKLQSLGPFIFYIPSRLGHSKALDNATECICSTYTSMLQAGGQRSKIHRHKYLQALRSLREGMLDNNQALSSNVLAAAVLLSWYEILAENLDNGWLAHIRGCAKLIQARGPSRHIALFDRALLDAEAGHVSAEALISCTASFLDSPNWQAVLNNHEGLPYQKDWYFQSLRASNRRLARVSTILSDFNHLINSIKQKTHNIGEIRAALKRYEALHSEIQDHSARVNIKSHTGIDQRRGCILTAKKSLALLKLDAHLFDILYLLGPDSYSVNNSLQVHLAAICTNHECELTQPSRTMYPINIIGSPPPPDSNLWVHLPFPDLSSQSFALNHLNTSISRSAISLKENVLLFKKVDHFGARRLTFLLRMVCTEARKRGSVHEIWKETEAWLLVLNRDDALPSYNNPVSDAGLTSLKNRGQ